MHKDVVAKCFAANDAERLRLWLKSYLSAFGIERISIKKHPLGFLYTTLEASESERIRLHFWTGDFGDQRLAIHDHAFDLNSFVLYGTICNTDYSVVPCLDPSGNQLYNVVYDATCSRLVSSGEFVEVAEQLSTVYLAGQFYFIPRNAFHSSRLESDEAITLVYMSRGQVDNRPRVIGLGLSDSSIEFYRSEVTIEEREDCIRLLTSTIGFNV